MLRRKSDQQSMRIDKVIHEHKHEHEHKLKAYSRGMNMSKSMNVAYLLTIN